MADKITSTTNPTMEKPLATVSSGLATTGRFSPRTLLGALLGASVLQRVDSNPGYKILHTFLMLLRTFDIPSISPECYTLSLLESAIRNMVR
jgi:hypothetical protein